MPSMRGHEKFASAVFLSAAIISLTVFLFYLLTMVVFPGSYVRDKVNVFPIPLIPNTYVSVLLIASIIGGVAIYLTYCFWRGFYSTTGSDKNFYGSFSMYFVFFMSMGILIGEIQGLLYPSTSVLNMPVMAYNFYGQVLISSYTILLQIIPILIIMAAYCRQNNLSFLDTVSGRRNMPNSLIFRALPVLISYDALVLYFLQGFDSLPFIVSTFVMSNLIFMKFGLPRAFLSNFIYIAVSVAGFSISSVSGLVILYEIYVFVILFGGIFMGSAILNRHVMSRINSRNSGSENTHVNERRIKEDRVKLWVYGSCPNCNNVNFALSNDLSLVCTKCGREIAPDEILPQNIAVVKGRVYVSGRSTSDDLYR